MLFAIIIGLAALLGNFIAVAEEEAMAKASLEFSVSGISVFHLADQPEAKIGWSGGRGAAEQNVAGGALIFRNIVPLHHRSRLLLDDDPSVAEPQHGRANMTVLEGKLLPDQSLFESLDQAASSDRRGDRQDVREADARLYAVNDSQALAVVSHLERPPKAIQAMAPSGNVGGNGFDYDPRAILFEKGFTGDIGTPLRLVSRPSSIDGGADGGEHRNEPKTGPNGGNPCLIEGVDGLCVGGVRTASSLYVGVSILLIFVCGPLASLSLCLSCWPGKAFDLRWAAMSLGFALMSAYGVYCAGTCKGYLFGI